MNKKFISMLFACVLSVAMCVPVLAEVVTEYGGYEASEIIEYYQDAAYDEIITLTEEEIEETRDYYESYGYTDIAAGYDQLLDLYSEIQGAELTDAWMETTDDEEEPIKVVYQMDNENGTFLCTLTMDESFTPIALYYEKEDASSGSLGASMAKAFKNMLIGMVTVFAVLILISFIISLLKYLPGLLEKKPKEEEAALEEEAVPAAPAAALGNSSENLTDDKELVAVISAAIAASMGAESTDGFVVRTIKKRRW